MKFLHVAMQSAHIPIYRNSLKYQASGMTPWYYGYLKAFQRNILLLSLGSKCNYGTNNLMALHAKVNNSKYRILKKINYDGHYGTLTTGTLGKFHQVIPWLTYVSYLEHIPISACAYINKNYQELRIRFQAFILKSCLLESKKNCRMQENKSGNTAYSFPLLHSPTIHNHNYQTFMMMHVLHRNDFDFSKVRHLRAQYHYFTQY